MYLFIDCTASVPLQQIQKLEELFPAILAQSHEASGGLHRDLQPMDIKHSLHRFSWDFPV